VSGPNLRSESMKIAMTRYLDGLEFGLSHRIMHIS
jgi:hypothetical protein